jgi:hypothetical protein
MLRKLQIDDIPIRKSGMRKSIAEILQQADEAATKKDKIEVLRWFDCPPLRTVLQACYDPNIKWLLPEGDPPYKPSNLTDIEGRLYNESKKLYLFMEGGNPNLTPIKRQNIFIQMLESMTPGDAKILIGCKDRQLPYKSINAKLVNEAFPGLIPEKQK